MLRLETDDNPGTQPLSKGKAIEGGGKFVIGQLYQGKEDEFNEGNIYQVRILLLLALGKLQSSQVSYKDQVRMGWTQLVTIKIYLTTRLL